MDIKKLYEIPTVEIIFFASDDKKTVSGGIELPDHEW